MAIPPHAPIRIGCSGWMYKHWRGLFYPEGLPVKRWFEHYAAVFDTVEINNSFYRLPKAKTFEAWKDQAPEGFCYAVKANRYLTQAKKLKDGDQLVPQMMEPIRHLGDRLGPVLYQLPPRFRINLERLESFLRAVPKDVARVFEFRDPSWYTDETFALLDRHSAGICVHDMPGSNSPRMAVGQLAYVRFHGAGGKYHGRYSAEALRDWAAWMNEQARSRAVWAYFNNDIDAHAVHDASALRDLTR